MTKAVNQLAAGQKSTGGLGTAARSPVVVNAGRGLGPMIVPNVQGRTTTTNLMRDAVAAQTRLGRIVLPGIFDSLSPIEQEVMSMRYGSLDNARRHFIRSRISEFKAAMRLDPAATYHNIFTSQGGIPLSTKLSMLNQAPLAALGWGPKSWRAAQLAPRQTLSNEAKKSIAGMAIS